MLIAYPSGGSKGNDVRICRYRPRSGSVRLRHPPRSPCLRYCLLCRLTAGNAETLPGVAIRRKLAGAQEAIVVGALLGIVLTLLEEFAPQHWRPWLPSTTGLGIAGVIPAFNSIAMFTGALVAWLVTRYAPKTGETYIVPVSSGLIAGESLVGVGIILTLELLKLATS